LAQKEEGPWWKRKVGPRQGRKTVLPVSPCRKGKEPVKKERAFQKEISPRQRKEKEKKKPTIRKGKIPKKKVALSPVTSP